MRQAEVKASANMKSAGSRLMSAACLCVLASRLLLQLQSVACSSPPDHSEAELCPHLDEPDEADADHARPLEAPPSSRAQKFPECGYAKTLKLARLNSTSRVAGGYNALPGEFPSYVFVRASLGNDISQCGGTILGPTHVLTAAHCLRGVNEVWVQPTLTKPRRSPRLASKDWFRAKRWCLHPEARRPKLGDGLKYDVAILKLERPIAFDQRTQSACLPDSDIARDQQAYAVGLGITRGPGNQVEARTLQVLPVKRSACTRSVDESRICFRSSNARYIGDTCIGDSGGPVLTNMRGRWTLVGATSYGPELCQAGSQGISFNAHIFNMRTEILRLIDTCN